PHDPCATPDCGHDRAAVSDAHLLDDAAVEGRAEPRRMGPRLADAHLTAGMEHGYSCRQPRAGCRAIEPPGRDDDGVLRHLPHSLPRLRDLDDADAGDLRVLRMDAGQLLTCGRTHPLPARGDR